MVGKMKAQFEKEQSASGEFRGADAFRDWISSDWHHRLSGPWLIVTTFTFHWLSMGEPDVNCS